MRKQKSQPKNKKKKRENVFYQIKLSLKDLLFEAREEKSFMIFRFFFFR